MNFMSLVLFFSLAWAADDPVYQIKIKDHRFSPAELTVPAGQTFWLEVINEDASTEEFESNSLKIEKIIAPRRTVKIRVKEISAGRHDIFGEFHPATCQGSINAQVTP